MSKSRRTSGFRKTMRVTEENDGASRLALASALETVLDYEVSGVVPVLTDDEGISHILLQIAVPEDFTERAVQDSALAKLMIEIDGERSSSRSRRAGGRAGGRDGNGKAADTSGGDTARIVGI